MEVALPNWSIRHLTIWTEVVQPTTLQAVTTIDVEEVEEVTAEAQFQDFRSKIAFLEWNVDACCLRCPFSSFVKSHVCLCCYLRQQGPMNWNG